MEPSCMAGMDVALTTGTEKIKGYLFGYLVNGERNLLTLG